MSESINIPIVFDTSGISAGLNETGRETDILKEKIKTAFSTAAIKGMMPTLLEAKQQMRELQQAMSAAAKAGDVEAYNKLRDKFSEVKEQAKIFRATTVDLSGSIGLVSGGFAQLTSVGLNLAMAFGSDKKNAEELFKVFTKVQAITNVAQGFSRLADDAKKMPAAFNNIIKALFMQEVATKSVTASQATQAVVTDTTTVAQVGLNTAMKANPIGLIVAGVVALGAAIAGMVYLFSDTTDSIEEFNKSMAEYFVFSDEQKKHLDELKDSIYELGLEYQVLDGTLTESKKKELLIERAANKEMMNVIRKGVSEKLDAKDIYNKIVAELAQEELEERLAIGQITTKEELKEFVNKSEIGIAAKKEYDAAIAAINNNTNIIIKEQNVKAGAEKRNLEKQDAVKETEEQKKRFEENQKRLDEERKAALVHYKQSIKDREVAEDLMNDIITNGTPESIEALKRRYELQKKLMETEQESTLKLTKDFQKELAVLEATEKRKESADNLSKELENVNKNEVQILTAKYLEQKALLEEFKKDTTNLTIKYNKDLAALQGNLGKSEIEILTEKYKKELALLQSLHKDTTLLTKKFQEDIAELQGNKVDNYLMKLLGVDKDGLNSLKGALKDVSGQLQDYFTNMASMETKSREKNLNVIDKKISDSENEIDRQKELYEQGVTNKYESEVRKNQLLKQEREKSLKDLQEAKVKEIEINTALEASGLIVTIVNLYKSLSSSGPWGIAAATLLSAGLVVAFAETKSQLIKDAKSTEYEQGGSWVIEGKSHKSGGVKVGDNKTAQGGERLAIFTNDATARNTGLEDFISLVNTGKIVIDRKAILNTMNNNKNNIVVNVGGQKELKNIEKLLYKNNLEKNNGIFIKYGTTITMFKN